MPGKCQHCQENWSKLLSGHPGVNFHEVIIKHVI